MNPALCASLASLRWGRGKGHPYPRLQGVGTVSFPPPAKCHSEPSRDCFVQVSKNKDYRWFQKFLEGVRRSKEGRERGGYYQEARQPVPCPGLQPKAGPGGWLPGSQPPSFLLTGNDFLSLCSHFLRLPNWISDSPSTGGRMGAEGPLGAAGQ